MTLDDGVIFKRHINQLHSTEVKNSVADVTHDEHSASVNEQQNNNEPNIGNLVEITNNTTDTNIQQPPIPDQPSTSTRSTQPSIPDQPYTSARST